MPKKVVPIIRGINDHGSLDAQSLLDDDHPQYLLRTGGTMTGDLVLSSTPTNANAVVPKSYVDSITAGSVDHGSVTGLSDNDHPQYLLRSGGTMNGPISLPADPTTSLQASTKQYVDAEIAAAVIGGGGGTGGFSVVVEPSGGNNDETLINTAINTANSAGGGAVMLRGSAFNVSAPIVIKSGVTLRGQGKHSTRLVVQSGFSGSAVITNFDNNTHGYEISNLRIEGGGVGTGLAGIWINHDGYSVGQTLNTTPNTDPDHVSLFHNLYIRNMSGNGLIMGRVANASSYDYNTHHSDHRESRFDNITIREAGLYGMYITGSDCWFSRCTVSTAGLDNYMFAGGNHRVVHTKAYSGTGSGFRIRTDRSQFTNLESQDIGGHGYNISGSDNIITNALADCPNKTSAGAAAGVYYGFNLSGWHNTVHGTFTLRSTWSDPRPAGAINFSGASGKWDVDIFSKRTNPDDGNNTVGWYSGSIPNGNVELRSDLNSTESYIDGVAVGSGGGGSYTGDTFKIYSTSETPTPALDEGWVQADQGSGSIDRHWWGAGVSGNLTTSLVGPGDTAFSQVYNSGQFTPSVSDGVISFQTAADPSADRQAWATQRLSQDMTNLVTRWKIRTPATTPTSVMQLLQIMNDNGETLWSIKLNSLGQLQYVVHGSTETTIGSAAASVSMNTEYVLQLKIIVNFEFFDMNIDIYDATTLDKIETGQGIPPISAASVHGSTYDMSTRGITGGYAVRELKYGIPYYAGAATVEVSEIDAWATLGNIYADLPDPAIAPSTGNGVELASKAYVDALPTGSSDALGYINVQASPYNAAGDGTTDDTTAINNALAAVGSDGGTVYFPPGTYLVNNTLNVKGQTQILGTETASQYAQYATGDPSSSCAVKVSDTFGGSAVWHFDGYAEGCSMVNMTTIGGNVGSVDGLLFTWDDPGRLIHNFTMQNSAVIGMGGDGITGHIWAGRFNSIFIGGCNGYGMSPTTRFSDVHVSESFITGCVQGGINLSGTQDTGLTSFSTVRFERSGWDSANPTSPTNSNAPGIRIGRANGVRFTNCDTDANSGHGVEIIGDGNNGGTYGVHDIKFVGCVFKRDGYGNMATQPNRAGIYIDEINGAEVQHVSFVDCDVFNGKADDFTDSPAYLHPKYGIHSANSAFLRINGGRFYTDTPIYPVVAFEGPNWRPSIQTHSLEQWVIPNASANPSLDIEGSMYWNRTENKLMLNTGSTFEEITVASSTSESFFNHYVIATPDASAAEKASADHTLTAGAGLAADLESKLSTYKHVYLVGTSVTLDDSVQVTGSDYTLTGDNVNIIVDPVAYTGSSGALAGVGPVQFAGTWTTIGGTGIASGAITEGDMTINVGTGHNVDVGNWLHIRGDTSVDILNLNRPTQYIKSEHKRVIATTATTITLEGGLLYSYANGANLTAWEITPAENIRVENLKFSYPSDGTTTEVALLNIALADRPIVRDCTFSGYDATKGANVKVGLALTTSRGATVENVNVIDIADTDQGYGVYINGSVDVVISRLHAYNCRHSVDAGQQWTAAGVPRNITVRDSYAYECFEAAFGTHGAEYSQFYNNVAVGCRGGIHVRGKNTVIDGLWVLGMHGGGVAAITLGETDSSEAHDGTGDGGTNVRIVNTYIDALQPDLDGSLGYAVYAPDSLIDSHIDIQARVEGIGLDMRGLEIKRNYLKLKLIGVTTAWLNGHGSPTPIFYRPHVGQGGASVFDGNTIVFEADYVPWVAMYIRKDDSDGGTLSMGYNHYRFYAEDTNGNDQIRFGNSGSTTNWSNDGVQYIDQLEVEGVTWGAGIVQNNASLTVQKPSYTAY